MGILRTFIRKFFLKRQRKDSEIFPEEILLDSQNLPDFDIHQFEGRLEKPITRRTILVLGFSLFLICFVFIGKLWFLQIKEGQAYSLRSENNNLKHTAIFANRGIIFDRNGRVLASNTLNPDGEFSLRSYTETNGMSHLLGYIRYPSKDKSGIYYDERFTGVDGVESFYDELLSGQNGLKITEINALGEVASESTLRPPRDGENLKLAIDSRVNEKFYEIISRTAGEFGFNGGAGVIMNVDTGAILSLVSFPEYDSDVMTQGLDEERISNFLNQKNNPFLNRVVSGLYIPGSIVKPFIAAGVLEENLIDPEKEILSTGSISIPNPYDSSKSTIFKDWKAHGWVDMRRALAVSSNVYFFSVGGGYGNQLGLGITKIKDYMNRFGFGALTGLDLEGEKWGNVPSPEWKYAQFEDEWRLGDTYNSSIGQYGFQVTPMQVVRGIAAVANGGFLVTPTVVEPSENKKVEAIKLSIKHENIKIVAEGLRESVISGTAAGLNTPGIAVAAKTGTAELGVVKDRVNSWSVGFFPYENPKYAFTVVMEQGPSGNQIGATYVMRQLLEWMYVNTNEYVR